RNIGSAIGRTGVCSRLTSASKPASFGLLGRGGLLLMLLGLKLGHLLGHAQDSVLEQLIPAPESLKLLVELPQRRIHLRPKRGALFLDRYGEGQFGNLRVTVGSSGRHVADVNTPTILASPLRNVFPIALDPDLARRHHQLPARPVP